jgi:hypothetical protein
MCIESGSFEGYVGMHKSWVDITSEKEQWTRMNIDRKRSLYVEKHCLKKLQNYCSIGDSRTE